MARHLTLLALLLGLSLPAFAQAQSKLPPCPPVDYSKNTHLERIAKMHNSFERYAANEGVIQGEFCNVMTSQPAVGL